MIIKKYLANTVEEALALVKQELGPSHVILTTRKVDNPGIMGFFSSSKVEVTAAVEEQDLKAHTSKKIPKKKHENKTSDKRAQESVEHFNESLKELKELVNETTPAAPAPTPAPVVNTTPAASATYGDPRLNRRPAAQAPQTPQRVETLDAFKHTTAKLVEQFSEETHTTAPATPTPTATAAPTPSLDELRKMIREEMQGAQKGVSVGTTTHNDEETVGSVRFLMSKGIARTKALTIEESLKRQFGEVDLSKNSPLRTQKLNAMVRELTRSVRTTGPITLDPSQPTLVALVGPTGVGKTTTLAKLAGHFKQNMRKKVALVSLDNVKLGAREQIEAISREHDLPVRTATTFEGMKEAVAAFYDQDLVLIDTGGRSQYQSTEVVALGDLLTADPRIQIYLTLSSTTKDVDCMGIVKQFSKMPLKGLIFTKLDETIAYGMMVNVCEKSGIPISYLTNGQKIPRDLQVADSEEIAKSILLQHNSAACSRIREMAS